MLKERKALSDFADYVEKQQNAQRQRQHDCESSAPSDSGYSSTTKNDEHAELDILDSLDLSDTSHFNLKQVLLDDSPTADRTLSELANAFQSRILEGHGETLFDLGQEDNGESMGFSKKQWDIASARLKQAAASIKADCRMLMTRNVGTDGEEEVGPVNEKDKSCTGKIMIRQKPDTAEDVIETRIAVVGNGEQDFFWVIYMPNKCSRRRKIYHAGCACQRQLGRW